MARKMFDPFGDLATAGYLRNMMGRKTASGVKRFEHREFIQNLPIAQANLTSFHTIDYNAVLDTHGILFGTVYPWAGQDRMSLAPQCVNGNGNVSKGAFVFAETSDIRKIANGALAIADQPAVMASHPGAIWGLLADAHPFFDGNGRVIQVVHAELCRRAAISIDWPKIQHSHFLSKLTEELKLERHQLYDLDGHLKTTSLDRFIAPFVRANPEKRLMSEHKPVYR